MTLTSMAMAVDDIEKVKSVRPEPIAGTGARPRLRPRAAFYLQASIVVFFLASSSAPTPLYALYQSRWRFSSITVTVIFGVYALAVLGALLTIGSLSDHVGRRPVLLASLATQIVVMVLFVVADGVSVLLIARVVQGLATGGAIGAIGAGMVDLDRERGTIANAVAPATGTAVGALLSGLLVQYLPAPTDLVYLLLLAIFVIQAAGVAAMSETSPRVGGAIASLRPRMRLPTPTRRAILTVAPVLVAVWSLASFYGSLGPTLVSRIAASHSPALGGLALFTLTGTGAVTILLLRSRSAPTLMTTGTAALLLGAGITLLGVSDTSIGVFFIGTAIAGAGFGSGLQGAIRTVLPLAKGDERAGVLSVIFIVSYLALGAPGVIAGVLVVHGGGLTPTAQDYAIAIMILAAMALINRVRVTKASSGPGLVQPACEVLARAGCPPA
jgi:MFS family permease